VGDGTVTVKEEFTEFTLTETVYKPGFAHLKGVRVMFMEEVELPETF
jgi:hypothetical protein